MSLEQSLRDDRGRWRRGVTGNALGRPRGSKNRWRRSDPVRAIHWTAGEWRLHYARILRTAKGDPGERAAAAYAGCHLLWRSSHPPKAQLGRCMQCGRPLGPPNATVSAAPLPFENTFIHACCVNQFALTRWHDATAALARFGINV